MIPLERGQLWVMRIHALAIGALALAAGLLGEAIVRDNVDLPPGIVTIPLGFATLIVVSLLTRKQTA